MKILKEGKNPTAWSVERECTGKGNNEEYKSCGATLLIEKDDLFMTSHTDYSCDITHHVTFKCAQCGALTDIDRGIIPRQIPIPIKKVWMENHQ